MAGHVQIACMVDLITGGEKEGKHGRGKGGKGDGDA